MIVPPLWLIVCLSSWCLPSRGLPEEDEFFVLSELSISNMDQLLMLDMDGDGARDLVRVSETSVLVHLMRSTGTFSVSADCELPFDGERTAWQLVDTDSDGTHEVLLLSPNQGQQLTEYHVSEKTFVKRAVLLEEAQAVLPRGVHRVPFARDIDEDGKADIVIPTATGFRIHRSGPGHAPQPPIEIDCDVKVEHTVGAPQRVDGRFRQEVRIPWFTVRDVDGDGLNDLVAETDDAAHFYIATPEIRQTPTWTLDLKDPEADAAVGVLGVDLDNLLGTLDDSLSWAVDDLDGEAPNDLLLHRDGVFRVFLGGSLGAIQRTPDQLLKVSGNVMHSLMRNVTGSSLTDLQVIRGPRISLGEVVRRLLVPGALDFDVYTYANEAGTLSKRPAKRSRLRLEIPSILSFMNRDDGEQDETPPPARRLRLNRAGEPSAIVDVFEGTLAIYADAVPDDLPPSVLDRVVSTQPDDLLETFLLRDLDQMKDGATRTISLEELLDTEFTSGGALRKATVGREPVYSRTLPCAEVTSLAVLDLDSDGLDDVMFTGLNSDQQTLAWILVARP